MFEQAQDKASAALRLSQELNDMAYTVLTDKLLASEAKRVVRFGGVGCSHFCQSEFVLGPYGSVRQNQIVFRN